jgi:glutathione S-transferase
VSGLRLYDYAASGNCYKVRLLLANLGREYERVPVDIFDGGTLTDEYARKNPAREVPVLELPDGRYLTQSGAILMYLAEGGELWPGDPFDRAQIVRWLLYEQTDVVPATGGLRFRLITGRLDPDSPGARQRKQAGEQVVALLEQHLADQPFFAAGRYTIADIAIYSYVHVAGEAGYDMSAYPNIGRWLERVASQPGYMNDLEPYPPNAGELAGRSIYG